MKQITVLILILVVSVKSLNAQPQLSKQSIKDFAAVCWFNYNYGNSMFIAAMNTYLPYRRSDIAVVMDRLDTDKEGREDVFQVFYKVSSGNYEALFDNLYSLKIKAANAKELATYILSKYGKPKGDPERKTNTGERIKTYSDEEVSYDYVETVQPNKSEKFFQGTKNYAGHIEDLYVVTITNNKIKIVEPNDNYAVLLDGIIKEGKILDKTGKESKFRYKQSTLYFHGNEKEWYVFYELEN